MDLHLVIVLVDGEIGSAYLFQTDALAKAKIKDLSAESLSHFPELPGPVKDLSSSDARLRIRHLTLPIHMESSL